MQFSIIQLSVTEGYTRFVDNYFYYAIIVFILRGNHESSFDGRIQEI